MSDTASAAIDTPSTPAEPTTTVPPTAAEPVTTAAAPAPAPATPPDPLAPKFAALARKDKEDRARAAAREQALEAREKAIAERVAKAERVEKALANRDTDPLAVFDALGIEIDKFADKLIEGPPKKKDPTQTAVEELRAQLEELRNERARDTQARVEKQRADAVAAFQKEIADTIQKSADKFELVTEKQAANLVYAVIDQHFAKTEKETGTGELLDIAEAAAMVEAALEKDVKTEAEFLVKSKSKKVQAALQAAGFTVAEAKKLADAATATTAPRAAASAADDTTDDRPLTTDEWLQAADEVNKKSMVLTNDVTASLPKYQLVKDDVSDMQRALDMLKFNG